MTTLIIHVHEHLHFREEKRMKKLLSLLLALVLTASLFAGCGSKDADTNQTNDTKETAADESASKETSDDASNETASQAEESKETEEVAEPFTLSEGIELQFWHAMSGDYSEVVEKICSDFNASNEYGITVVPTYQGGYSDLHAKVMAALQTDEIPNLAQAYGNNIIIYTQSEKVVKLDDYITNADYGISDFDDILEGYRIENSSYPDGGFYSLPFNKSTEVMYYNKTFFEENGLEVPTTLEELKNVSIAASDILGKPAFGYDSLENLFITWVQQYGGDYTNANGDVLFDTPEAREALQFFVDGVDGGYFRAAGEDKYMSGPFNNGDAVMFIGSTSGSAYIGSDEFEWDCAQVPMGSERKVIQQGSNMFMLKSSEEEQIATFIFMNYLMSPEVTAYWAMNTGYLPVRQSARELPEYLEFVESGVNPTKSVGTSYEGSDYIFDPIFPDSYDYRVAVGTAVEEAIAGLKTVDQAISDAMSSLQ